VPQSAADTPVSSRIHQEVVHLNSYTKAKDAIQVTAAEMRPAAAASQQHIAFTWPPSVERKTTDTLRSLFCRGRLGGPLDPSELYMTAAAQGSPCTVGVLPQ
jgi:hypothetical protein